MFVYVAYVSLNTSRLSRRQISATGFCGKPLGRYCLPNKLLEFILQLKLHRFKPVWIRATHCSTTFCRRDNFLTKRAAVTYCNSLLINLCVPQHVTRHICNVVTPTWIKFLSKEKHFTRDVLEPTQSEKNKRCLFFVWRIGATCVWWEHYSLTWEEHPQGLPGQEKQKLLR